MSSEAEGGLTIGAVAARTGLSIPTLRAWETRHGFPTPLRLAGGQRRYRESDVELLRRVDRARRSGLSLDAAVAQVRRGAAAVDDSVFAALRRAHPELAPNPFGRRTMLAISRAIEDECCAVAAHPVLVGAFQSEASYRREERRWADLAATASAAIVLAQFERSQVVPGGVTEVALPPTAPLLREWFVVCDAPEAAACLAGWERPGSRFEHRRDRVYEAVWSVDPAVVRTAAEVAVGIARSHSADVPELEWPPPGPAGPALRRATAVTNRVVAYLDELSSAGVDRSSNHSAERSPITPV